MMRSLFSGVSGLKTHQTKMDVIGNNIANVNTVAFKSSSTTFQDLMYQTTSQASGASTTKGGVNAKQIGLGVTNGATKISITSAGAAQSTGDALDIRLTDTKTTNFFIVSNGSENLFTRAGSFYVDNLGNLAMTTTGYFVMGWQVDEETGSIKKDTVSKLQVMSTENQTSSPEATTKATFSGVIDKNDTDVTSSSGYVRSLTFYDAEGYSYTAKFTIKVVDATEGTYSIALTNVYDSDNNDILASYIAEADDPSTALANIFGTSRDVTHKYSLSSSFVNGSYGDNYQGVYYTSGDNVYAVKAVVDDDKKDETEDPVTGYNFYLLDEDGNYDEDSPLSAKDVGFDDTETLLTSMFGITKDEYESRVTSPSDSLDLPTLEGSDVYLKVDINEISSEIQFDTKTGILDSVGDGGTTLNLQAMGLGPNREDPVSENAAISNITIDYSGLLNYDNGGTSTVTVSRGDADGDGAGKKLGTMTGLSISDNGMIYGSYSNGNTVLLGQIAVAQFANASGLEEMGDNCYKTTLNSGDFDGIGVDISADGSSMATGQLEMSNVDLSSEFTEMIVTQRGFQANSRIITVSDTLLEELINLKR